MEPAFEDQRRRMVADQLLARGIRDPLVIRSMARVPRHLFVPAGHLDKSYSDHPLPIGEGQTISQPYMVALMIQEMALKPAGRVLEIGTGSGYEAAVLSLLASKVYSVERVPALADSAAKLLRSLSVKNVQILIADGTAGWPDEAPFQGILVAAAAPRVPEVLVNQLAPGGRLVIPVGSALSQTLTVVRREAGGIETREICGCVFVPLIGAHGWKEGEVSSEEVL
ncbi:MAG: protein-L-isoaspartate(D-aspartate) O-methyltransferase [Candidatus Omnitrophica bacterium]|nr:protein-L-isoaspartate(D-aspartate) O-methyltransferase [Candidatus Omnitrophota bacterium]